MANIICNLCFEFENYWHAGTGITGGNHLDAIVQKDSLGLPVLNGRHIKGLLRQSVRLNEAWGAFSDITKPAVADLPTESEHYWEDLLFGSRNQEESSDKTRSGVLFVSDASLTPQESSYISEQGLADNLYKTLFNTRVNAQGVADDKTLRAIQVSVPMALTAELEINTQKADTDDSQKLLNALVKIIEISLPLIRYAGGHRTRGLGRVAVTMTNKLKEAA